MFPTAEMLGIDLVLPDFTCLRERADDIEAIVLTHGHEDHVGALPYVLRELGIPEAIYGGPLTLGLVRSKLEERKIRDAPLEGPGARRARSAPDRSRSRRSTCRTRSRTRARSRSTRSSARSWSPATTASTRRRSTACPRTSRGSRSSAPRACSACAATRPTPTGPASSRRRRPSARRSHAVFAGCEGRIIVTCFASNVHRVQQVIDAAGGPRPQGGAGRPLDAQELQHRLQPRDGERARRAPDPAQGDRGLPRPQGDRDLHRQPGRAALRPAADGVQRPPRRRAALRTTRSSSPPRPSPATSAP